MNRAILITTKRAVLLTLVFLLILSLGTLALAGDLEEIKQRGVLRHLGIPYANFVTGSGDGLDVDLVKGFAAHLGLKYEYVRTDWTHIIGDLTGHQIKVRGDEVEILDSTPVRGDLIANGLTILPWRQKVLNFSIPSFPTQVWLIARADSPIQPIKPSGNLAQDIQAIKKLLPQKTILDLPNTCLDANLYQLRELGGKVVDFSGGLNDLAPALIDGQAELLLLDVADALVALEKWPQEIKVIGPVSERQTMGLGFAKSSPELLKAFNQYFEGIKADGSYAQMVRKYYPNVFLYFGEFFSEK